MTMNNDIIVIHCLVATSLSTMWHLQAPPSVLLNCDMVLVALAVVVVGTDDRCGWWPLVVVRRWWVSVVNSGGGG